MAPVTQIDPADVVALLEEFDAGELRGFGRLAAGAVSSNYRVETARGPLFLRVNEGKTEAEVQYELRVIEHLARAGVPTPQPFVTRAGRGWARRPAGLVSLFPWVPGRVLDRGEVQASHARQVGAALAGLHRAGADFADLRPGRYTAAAIITRLRSLADRADEAVAAAEPALWDEVAWLPGRRSTDLPRGLIHQDLFRDNVLFEDDRLAALLDFEQACGGSLAYDVAVCLLDWCFDERFDFARGRALLAGYQTRRPLAPEERAGLYAEARFAALRFTVTRIADVHLAGVAVRAGEKDFRRYLGRLAELRALGEAGFRRELGL